jgi:hypothetical protein
MLTILTPFHVAVSLAAIALGFAVVFGMLNARSFERTNAWFLTTTVLTSATSFLFPFNGVTPGIVVGILSLLILGVAILARYKFHLAGGWEQVYVVTAVTAFYFNFFVLVAQSFQKIPLLHELAPTQSEPPFAVAQLIVLIVFAWLGYRAHRLNGARRLVTRP